MGEKILSLKPGSSEMDESSFEHLIDVFVTEAVSSAKNEICALKAQREGRMREARAFRALALAQRVHWNKALMLLRGKASSTDDNLADTVRMLESSIHTYKAMLGETNGAVKGFVDQFLRTARNHLGILKKSTERETTYFVCRICGFIAMEKKPESCPVCGAIQEKFEEVS